MIEVNLDGFVGPTHHLGGLGVGNLASQQHRGRVAYPRAAALQGLDKIDQVARLGIPQFVLPPQSRPNFRFLQSLGFHGSAKTIWSQVAKTAPELLSVACSASSMWAANAATVTPACDTLDRRTQFTIANLLTSYHRSHEPPQTLETISLLFSDRDRYVIHPPLPGAYSLRDEGAANHLRLSDDVGEKGIHLFVYGDGPSATVFTPRQSKEACAAIIRRHQIIPGRAILWPQHPEAISHGAFHNDVVATSTAQILLHHQQAFDVGKNEYESLARLYHQVTGEELERIEVGEDELPLDQAVESYLFNSQLFLEGEQGRSVYRLFCPQQCLESEPTQHALARIQRRTGRIKHVDYVDLRESMHNGGGPACLRLRVPLSAEDLNQLPSFGRWTAALSCTLREVVLREYPETQTLDDLADLDRLDQWLAAETAVRVALGWPASQYSGW